MAHTTDRPCRPAANDGNRAPHDHLRQVWPARRYVQPQSLAQDNIDKAYRQFYEAEAAESKQCLRERIEAARRLSYGAAIAVCALMAGAVVYWGLL